MFGVEFRVVCQRVAFVFETIERFWSRRGWRAELFNNTSARAGAFGRRIDRVISQRRNAER